VNEQCYYYLHTNGDLIRKPFGIGSPLEYFDSPFVKKWWRVDTANRLDAWNMVVEALALGANRSRCAELAGKWGLTMTDSLEYLPRVESPSEVLRDGFKIFIDSIFDVDEDAYWDWFVGGGKSELPKVRGKEAKS
jgi:hypothetical protein